MKTWAVVLACGPTDAEIERVADVLESVFHYEPGTRWVAVIDSGEEDRNLAARFAKSPGTTLVGIRNPKPGRANGQWGGLCVGVLAAYQWVVRHTDARFVIKYDSDALTINPFAAPMFQALADNPLSGVFGSYLRDCNGYTRDYRGMAGLMKRLHRLALTEYQPNRFGRRFPLALFGRPKTIRDQIARALANGYHFGEHVQGGAYGVSRELLNRMERWGYFDQRLIWADTEMSEDVMIGMYALAVGLGLAGLAATGEVFGVKHVGLPDTVERLVERGYSVIHSLKNDPRLSEAEIRAFFKARRQADLSAAPPLRLTPAVSVAPAAVPSGEAGRASPGA
ncbi:MAG: hypothetical protein JWO31_41 [Phycisphaerales bacterium]|nr:hypothetical protein [Phycisphaerales bacterium]